jgi:hypothetical protein
MKPTWLIEADVFGAEAEPLKAEIRRQGMACHVVRHDSLFGGRPETVRGRIPSDDECVIFYGSCSADDLACSTYYGYFGRYLLNRRYVMLPGVEAIRLRDWLFEVLARDDKVFVRPSGMQKLFTGRCIDRDEFAIALAPARYDPATLVVVAEPREIAREWRLVIAEGRVIAASQYARGGAREFVPDCPAAVRTFADEILGGVSWRPDAMFMMDVGESEGRLSLVELNSFSCSGLYRCDLAAVVETASRLAASAWQRGNPDASPGVPSRGDGEVSNPGGQLGVD